MGTLLPTVTSNSSDMERTTFQKVGSALFYAVCSNTLVFVNKSLLTNDAFPSRTLLGCGQMVSGKAQIIKYKKLTKITTSNHNPVCSASV